MKLNQLERRIVDLSFLHKLSHISSCLNTVNLLADIYAKKKPEDIVVLCNGHAGLALYVTLESIGMCNAEEMIEKHGVHPSRDVEHGIMCSSGSLGQAESICVGLALADKNRTVWMVTSDGSCAEGSVYESMRIAQTHCPNLKAFVIFNGMGAYGPTYANELPDGFTIEWKDETTCFPSFLCGLAGHYVVLSKAQHEELMND